MPSLESTIRFRGADATDSTPWREATLLRIAPDTFIVRVCDKCADSLVDVTPLGAYAIEVRHVRFRRGWHIVAGAAIGAGVGTAVLFGAIGICATQPATGDGPGCGVAIIFLPAFATGGAIIGGVVGALLPGREWEPLALR